MRMPWPRSLAGRITLLMLGGLTLLHVGSMIVHERALHGATSMPLVRNEPLEMAAPSSLAW